MILLCSSIVATAQNDSLICLPKQQLIEAISDINSGDQCAEEKKILENNIQLFRSKIVDIQAQNQELRKIENSYKEEKIAWEEKSFTQDDQLVIANKKVKTANRQKNGIIIGGVTLTVGLAAGLIYLSTL